MFLSRLNTFLREFSLILELQFGLRKTHTMNEFIFKYYPLAEIGNHNGNFNSALNNSIEEQLNQSCKFFGHESLTIFLFPDACTRPYLFPHPTWPKYCSFRVLIVFISSGFLFIRHSTSSFVFFSIHDIFNIRRYTHNTKARILSVSCFYSIHALIPYITEKL